MTNSHYIFLRSHFPEYHIYEQLSLFPFLKPVYLVQKNILWLSYFQYYIEDKYGKDWFEIGKIQVDKKGKEYTANYLINNDINSNSSKNKSAKSLNIPIITEEEFLEKFGQNWLIDIFQRSSTLRESF